MIENKRIIIRPMQEDDLDAVMVIDRLSFSLPWPESAYRHDLFDNSNALLRVAEDSDNQSRGLILGLIDVWLILDEAHIATIAVHPDYRNQGIATKLIEAVLLEAEGKGACKAMLEVRTSNQAAQTLYQKFGFQVVHRRRKYYIDNKEDALLMNLDNLTEWVKSSELIKARKVLS
ncbi:MAG: ribosomal protein S18-alanine N-acetyltransferase [Anaerolineales bacterium]|jgi:ribosomal-protein-alanine N-acetyltransferase